jgi:hypothetical protein
MMEIFNAVVAADYGAIERGEEEIPERMVRAIRGALKVDVDERIQTCEQLLELWCDGRVHEIPFDSDEVRWSPELLEKARSLGAGDHAMSMVSGSEAYASWTGEFSAEAKAARESAETTSPVPAQRSSSGSLVVLAMLLLVVVGGWFWNKQARELDEPTSRGHSIEPTAPRVKAKAPVEAVVTSPEEQAEADAKERAKEREEERKKKREKEQREAETAAAALPEAEPPPVEPKPAPTTGSFSVSGPMKKVRLRGANGQLYGPGTVPPGSYSVLIARGGKLERVLRVKISAGEHRKLKCNSLGCK